MVMNIRSRRFRLLFLGAQGVHLGLDRWRAHDGRLRDRDPLVGGHHTNDAPDYGPPLRARSAHEERDLRTVSICNAAELRMSGRGLVARARQTAGSSFHPRAGRPYSSTHRS